MSNWTGGSCFVLEIPPCNLHPGTTDLVPCDWVMQRTYYQWLIKSQNLLTIKYLVLLLANDHLSTATFLCPPGVHCGEVWLYGIKKPFSMATFCRTCHFQVPNWNIHQILAVDSEKYQHVLYSIFNFGYIGSKLHALTQQDSRPKGVQLDSSCTHWILIWKQNCTVIFHFID